MSLSLSLLINLAVAMGLGSWWRVPSPAARLLLGCVSVPMALLAADMGLGLGLRGPAWVLAVFALLGLALRRPFPPGLWRHPVVVLPLLVALVAAVSGDFVYRPHSWDEFSAWLTWPREAFLDNSFLSPEAGWTAMGYTQGLPALMVFPQLFFPGFDAGRSAAPFVILHAGLMGLVWEEVQARRSGDRQGMEAWAVVLVLLAAEAGWTLVPQLMLVETPQIHLIAAVLLLLARLGRDGEWVWWTVGILAAGGYLIKATGAALIPALAFGWLLAALLDRRSVRPVSLLRLMVAPVVVYLGWRGVVPVLGAGHCASNPLATLADWGRAGLAMETAGRMLRGMGDYVMLFKAPVTVAALAGLGLGVASRREVRPVLVVLLAWLAAYGAGLLVTYAFCFTDYEREQLASLPRYTSVALRVLHVVGLVLLGDWLLARLSPFGRLLRLAVPVAVLLLGLYQLRAVAAGLENASRRDRENPQTAAVVFRVLSESEALAALVATLFADRIPDVALITQGGDGFEWVIARQAALGLSPPVRRRFRVRDGFSWGERATDPWMVAGGSGKARASLATAHVIWPMAVDPWMAGTLAPLVDDPACRSAPEAYFLVRVGEGRFACLPKDQMVRP